MFLITRSGHLDPMERISEILFGLVMVLVVTSAFSVLEAEHRDVGEMLKATLGCNFAWGVIDAVFYLMARFSEKSRGIIAIQRLRQHVTPHDAQTIVADHLPAVMAQALTPRDFELIGSRLSQISDLPTSARLTKEDWTGAFAVFALVFSATLPVVIPFVVFKDVSVATRTSNAIAIGMLFITGYAFGRYTGNHKWLTGLAMVAVGSGLVAVAMALGG